MTDRYQKELGRFLRCTSKTKKQLLSKFRTYQIKSLDDCATNDYDQMVSYFGPPEEMAQILMQEVEPDEHKRFHRSRTIAKSTLAVIAVLWLLLTIHIYHLKSIPVIENGITYIDSSENYTIETEESE